YMKIRLSRGIGEFERTQLNDYWEPPSLFSEVLDDRVWVIYGRKGSGKSTLVEYISSSIEDASTIIIRPRNSDLFRRILATLKNFKEDDRIAEESVSNLLEYIIYTSIMNHVVGAKTTWLPSSPLETIYNYLVQHKLNSGSVLRKAINLFKAANGELKLSPTFDGVLDVVEGDVSYEDAVYALMEYMAENKRGVLVCLDDIDELGFNFSDYDRIFSNSILICVLRLNTRFIESKTKIRILLTIPSELYFHSSFWGGDWASHKSEYLAWPDGKALKRLVNKRIAIESNTKKHKPRFDGDKYSIDNEHTWKRVFPETLINQNGRRESSFNYILKHTFYTPRHLLGICDNILRNAGCDDLSELHNFTESNWNQVIKSSVQEFSMQIDHDLRGLFSRIYNGLEDILYAFRSRPSIWSRAQLFSYLNKTALSITRADTGEVYSGESLVEALYRIGFIGYGVLDMAGVNPGLVQAYRLHFSFIDKNQYRGGWDIAVISPIFYWSYGIREITTESVLPHQSLRISNKDAHSIMLYDHETNTSNA
ncbi:MAG: ATP-binding protein, partial [Candidatus Thiodiazotropha taylori]|nr:ATP-binding protein [Candidatus Thiodiazotropha taylori]